jgi:hypothetical protein
MATLLSNAPADPVILFSEEIADLMLEARNYLDGEPIANEQQAQAVSSILNRARRIEKDADELRKEEKRPHDDAAKAVQARWTPLLNKAALAASTAKQALAPWLRQLEKEQEAKAEAARREAERLAEIAAEARRKATGNLEAAEDAERLLKVSVAAQRDATRASKAKAHATGGERKVGLVDVFTPELTDPVVALAYYRRTQAEALKDWLTEQARKDVHAGARELPGFTIKHDRIAR